METEIGLWEKSRSRKTIENGGTHLDFANRFLQVCVWFVVGERTGIQDLYTVPNPPKKTALNCPRSLGKGPRLGKNERSRMVC